MKGRARSVRFGFGRHLTVLAICVLGSAPVVQAGQRLPADTGSPAQMPRPTRPPRLEDVEALNSLHLDFLSATPSKLIPFEPPSVLLSWRVLRPHIAPAGPINLLLNELPVQFEGKKAMRPTVGTVYRLRAKLRRESREMGMVRLAADTSGCRDLPELNEKPLADQVLNQVKTSLPPEHLDHIRNPQARVDIAPGQVNIHIVAGYEYAVSAGGVTITDWPDPDIKIDVNLALAARGGRLVFPDTRVNVNIDADFVADAILFFADPNRKRNIEAEISLKVSRAVEQGFQDFVQTFLARDFRLWSTRIVGRPGSGNYDYIRFLACPYPQPWVIKATFAEVKLYDTWEKSREAKVRLNFSMNGRESVYPPYHAVSIALDSKGESQVFRLPRSVSDLIGEVRVGILDPLIITVTLRDEVKEVPCFANSTTRPPCRPPPPLEITKQYGWENSFSRGSHMERSRELASESFEVTYAIAVRWDCRTCATTQGTIGRAGFE